MTKLLMAALMLLMASACTGVATTDCPCCTNHSCCEGMMKPGDKACCPHEKGQCPHERAKAGKGDKTFPNCEKQEYHKHH